MALDELLKGFAALQQGMQEFAVGEGIRDAQSQVQELQAAQMNEMQKRSALQGIANNLTSRLNSLGAPIGQIQSAVGAVAPEAIKSAEDAFLQGTMKGSPELKKIGRELQAFETAPKKELLGIQNQADIAKFMLQLKASQAKQQSALDKEGRGILVSAQKEFNSQAAKLMPAIRSSNAARQLLDSGNKLTYAAVRPLLARMSGDVGNLSEFEQKVYEGSPALHAKVKRWAKLKSFGDLPASDKEEMKNLVQIYAQSSQDYLTSTAKRIAEQRAGILQRDPQEVLKLIYPDAPTGTGGSSGAPVPIGSPQTIRDPKTGTYIQAQKFSDGQYRRILGGK